MPCEIAQAMSAVFGGILTGGIVIYVMEARFSAAKKNKEVESSLKFTIYELEQKINNNTEKISWINGSIAAQAHRLDALENKLDKTGKKK